MHRASVLVYYKDSFHYKSERDSPIGLLELSHCTGIYSSSSDNRIFTIRSVDVDFVLKARFEDSVEGWKTAIQCSWDLARKDFEIQGDALSENSVLNQVIDLELKLHSLASPDRAVAEFLGELTSSFTVHYSFTMINAVNSRCFLFSLFPRRFHQTRFPARS